MTADVTLQGVQEVMRNVLAVLQADPRNYRKFGVFWWPVKALLRRFYTRDNLYMLGTFEDPDVAALVPNLGLSDMLAAAFEEYEQNARLGLGSAEVQAPNGEAVRIYDPDAGL
ncbi:MAG TPA: hypothetical protein VFL54_04515 [Gammaproteobacteria bacterium]|nr:hypothetical protein [Gammaproteobacteria bacterium]